MHQRLLSRNFREELKLRIWWGGESVSGRPHRVLLGYNFPLFFDTPQSWGGEWGDDCCMYFLLNRGEVSFSGLEKRKSLTSVSTNSRVPSLASIFCFENIISVFDGFVIAPRHLKISRDITIRVMIKMHPCTISQRSLHVPYGNQGNKLWSASSLQISCNQAAF